MAEFDINTLTLEQQEALQKYLKDIFMSQMKAEKALKVRRFEHLNTFARPGQIVFAGSSLMEQFPINELLMDLELPYMIYNRGIGGYTTSEMLETMKPCIYDLKPKVLFLNIGTNDLNDAVFESAAFRARYETLLNDIRTHLPETKVFLMEFYPVNPVVGERDPYMGDVFKRRTNARIREASAIVEELATQFGHTYLKVNQGLTDACGNLKEEFTVEGMHMFANGYRAVLENLLPVLRQL